MELKVYTNPEKDEIKKTRTDETNLKFTRPFSMLIIGKSGVGKSNLVKNIIAQNDFDIIYLMHANEFTTEYNDIEHIKYELGDDYIDRFMDFPDKVKLLIIDDIDFNNMSNKIKNYMYKLITYVCARGTSIIATSQDPTYYPPMLRRSFNLLVVYPVYNKISIRTLSDYTSPVLSADEMVTTFKNFIKTKYDFIIINKLTGKAWICIKNKIRLLKDSI